MKEVERDFLAVQEDALLIDIVAAREDLSAFADDHIAQLLGAYTSEIDVGLELLAHAELPTAPAPVVPIATASTRRRSGRFLVAATAAAVLVGTSGVAAAVTGDPLTPFRSVVKAVTGGDETPVDDPGRKSDELPDEAAAEAAVALSLNEVNQALRDGNVEKAQRLLDEILGTVGGDVDLAPGLETRIDKMQDKLDAAANGDGRQPGAQGQRPSQPGETGKGNKDQQNNANSSHPSKPDKAGTHIPDSERSGDQSGQQSDSTGSDTGSDTSVDQPGKPANSGSKSTGRSEKGVDKTKKADATDKVTKAGSTDG